MAKFDNWFLRPIQGFTQSKIEKAISTWKEAEEGVNAKNEINVSKTGTMCKL